MLAVQISLAGKSLPFSQATTDKVHRTSISTQMQLYLKQFVNKVNGEEQLREPGLSLWHDTMKFLFGDQELVKKLTFYVCSHQSSPSTSWKELLAS